MPSRQKPVSSRRVQDTTLVVDNGAFTIKAGFASEEPNIRDCHVIPNGIARDRERKVWIGPELANCKDFGELAIRRPVEKGYVVNWESERAIWNQSFFGGKAVLKVRVTNSRYPSFQLTATSAIRRRQIWFLRKLRIAHRLFRRTVIRLYSRSLSLLLTTGP